MKVRKTGFLILLAIAVVAAGYGMAILRRGFSAREQPSSLEATVARTARNAAIPGNAKYAQNPFKATPDNLRESREHFADHCATCHANDGSGKTEIGQNFYPKVPDMRLPQTQNLTDGEIYYIIHNGVRLTGMPAWGDANHDLDSWKLVLFIRHLAQLTPEEEKDMVRFNPQSEMDREEKQKEEQFLNGEDSSVRSQKEETHHQLRRKK
jgi:mono/diheme cytochrome c family protein